MNTYYLSIAQTTCAILAIVTILLQQRGTAIGSAFGGGSEHYATQRGAQKTIFILSIVFAIAFIALSIWRLAL